MLYVIYAGNGEFVPSADGTATLFAPVVLLETHSLTLTAENAPFMFYNPRQNSADSMLKEDPESSSTTQPTDVTAITQAHPTRVARPATPGASATDEVDRATTRLEPYYYLSPTRWAGHYVNTYGPLPGLTMLAPLALLRMIVGDLRHHVEWVWRVGKLWSALLAALSVALLYLASRELASREAASVVALLFGLGTVVWPVASQTPYQQTFALPWLVLGTLLALGDHRRTLEKAKAAVAEEAPHVDASLVCGVSFGIAAAIRAPLAFYALSFGAMHLWVAARALLLQERPASSAHVASLAGAGTQEPVAHSCAVAWRRLCAFAIGCALPGLALITHNQYFFGSWNGANQLQQTAAAFGDDAWRTPLWAGLAGLLFSPSRGLCVYSPFVLLSVYGAVCCWRQPRWAPLRPFVAASIAITIVYAKWSMWWGGWSFGPRLLIDIMPVACLLVLPALDGPRNRNAWRAAVAVMLSVAMFNSALGAVAYDLIGWNAREGFAVIDDRTGAADLYMDRSKATAAANTQSRSLQMIHMDVDRPAFRHRLWRVKDSPLPYYASHFNSARQKRRGLMKRAFERTRWERPASLTPQR